MDQDTDRAFAILLQEIGAHLDDPRGRAVTPRVDARELRRQIELRYRDLSSGRPLADLARDAVRMLREWNVQITHPRYFGLFNPSVKPASVLADALVSLFNPNLAARAAAQGACAIERFTLDRFLDLLGFPVAESEASFTSGGGEANHQSLLAALAHRFPRFVEEGAAALGSRPVLYLSADAHGSLPKAAQACGLGRRAVRTVRLDSRRRLDPADLAEQIARDREEGFAPFFVAATAGTTAAGALDPIAGAADVAEREGLWLHVDAAWGGLALLSPKLRPLLAGIERADSVTWDAHKGLSVPLGAGMFFTRHRAAAERAFTVDAAYMPRADGGGGDPYALTLQWSRRFIGLKVFLTLASSGLEGIAAEVERMAAVGEALRQRLREGGWRIINETPLPVVCFTHERIESGAVRGVDLLDRVLRRGRVWLSHVKLDGRFALRACITSFLAGDEDVQLLVEELRSALA
jgi:glutamate/tyrosine decarboxylase-like PLP-dependent enzyme